MSISFFFGEEDAEDVEEPEEPDVEELEELPDEPDIMIFLSSEDMFVTKAICFLSNRYTFFYLLFMIDIVDYELTEVRSR